MADEFQAAVNDVPTAACLAPAGLLGLSLVAVAAVNVSMCCNDSWLRSRINTAEEAVKSTSTPLPALYLDVLQGFHELRTASVDWPKLLSSLLSSTKARRRSAV